MSCFKMPTDACDEVERKYCGTFLYVTFEVALIARRIFVLSGSTLSFMSVGSCRFKGVKSEEVKAAGLERSWKSGRVVDNLVLSITWWSYRSREKAACLWRLQNRFTVHNYVNKTVWLTVLCFFTSLSLSLGISKLSVVWLAAEYISGKLRPQLTSSNCGQLGSLSESRPLGTKTLFLVFYNLTADDTTAERAVLPVIHMELI